MCSKWFFRFILFLIPALYSLNAFAQDDFLAMDKVLEIGILTEEEQISILQNSLRGDSTDISGWLMLGMLYENAGQIDKAVEAYHRAHSMDGQCERCLQLYANALSLQGRVSLAMELFQHAVELYPNNASIRSQYARLLKRESLFSLAFVQYSHLIERDSSNFYLWEQLGDCALRMEMSEIGISAYVSSLDLNTANVPLALKLINTLVKSDFSPTEIMPYADAALACDSTYVPLLKAKGLLFYLAHDYKSAIPWFADAMAKGDTSLFTLKYMGISNYHVGNFYRADELLTKAYALDTLDKNLNFFYARALIELGDGRKAVKLMESTIDFITPLPVELAAYHGIIGEAYQKVQMYQKAVAAFRKAIELDPAYLSYLYEQGLCHYYSKEYELAKEIFTRFIGMAEEDPTKKYKSSVSSAKYWIKRIDGELFFEGSPTVRNDTIFLPGGEFIIKSNF